jgi:4-aminobutyrate aminotransferase
MIHRLRQCNFMRRLELHMRVIKPLSNVELDARKVASTPRGVGVLCNFFVDRAKNAEVWDVEGRRFIDFGGGIGVLNTGHRHPKLVAAIREQLDRFTHTAYQIAPYAGYVELAERINARTPGTHQKKTAFFTTGAEAVENAVKIARAATGRPGIIALGGGFHGRTYMGMSLTGKVAPYKLGFGPLPSGVYHVPAPVAIDCTSSDDSMRAIEALFRADIDPRQVAAFIVEPVQGEGGFHMMPAAFMRNLRKLCDEHRILLIADEVQSGFARTGRLFAMEHYEDVGVLPDLMTLAKSLAGGIPLSAVCGRAEVMDAPAPGGLGGTYAGNPLAIASALAVLDVIDDERLCDRANALGDRLKAMLITTRETQRRIADIRGPGAMIAVEFRDPATNAPDAAFAKTVQQSALAKGLLLLTCGTHGNVIRFLFPLTVEDTVFEEGLAILQQALNT